MTTTSSRIACRLVLIIGLTSANMVSASSDNQFLAGINSDNYSTRLDSLKIIERSMVENQKVFTILETRLLTNYQANSTDTKHIDEMAWTCKALASSADKRYQKTIQTVTESANSLKLQKHCSSALDRLSYYEKRREVLSQPRIEGLSVETSNTIHLISSENPEMIRSGIRMIMTSKTSDERVFDKVRDVLLSQYNNSTDSKFIDSLAWLCKGLASSGNPKYIEALSEVEKNAKSTKLQRYARSSRNKLE